MLVSVNELSACAKRPSEPDLDAGPYESLSAGHLYVLRVTLATTLSRRKKSGLQVRSAHSASCR